MEGAGNGYGSVYAPTIGPGGGGTIPGLDGGGGGGGHGGAGGNVGTSVGGPSGSANDSPTDPILMGSGGTNFIPGIPDLVTPGLGGAAFLLNAPSGTVSINGTIDMSGFTTLLPGAGAGGTISISAQTIFFNGILNASGGKGGNGEAVGFDRGGGGGGGGGIIHLCPSLSPLTSAGTYSVAGGNGGSSPIGVGGSPGMIGIYTACVPPTPAPTPYINIFYVSLNSFTPAQGSVSIFVETNSFPGAYALNVYNSAGEHIKTLDSQTLSGPLTQSYSWDGTNKYKATCASGVYIFDLIEPLSHQQKRVLFIR